MQSEILLNKENKKNLKEEAGFKIITTCLNYPLLRKLFFDKVKKSFYEYLVLKNPFGSPREVQIKKYRFINSLLDSVDRTLKKGFISPEVAKKAFKTLGKNLIHSEELMSTCNEFKKKYGDMPPAFIVLGPTQKCNLTCKGCYASSKYNAPTLPYDIIDKIAGEIHDEWGSRFMTITGGEPLMYNSNGKTLFDLWEKYNDMFFLFYTNGTLITEEVAKKLAKLGNVTPAISIEGYEKETDERRGKGVYEKMLNSVKNLKKAGVPFGISVTATSKNFDILKDDKFYDFVFNELGAVYMWMFQLMPIGQACDMRNCMINPEQRIELYNKWVHLLEEKKYCIADFWNSGVLTDGCIAFGRRSGYLYIDWNGNITPCTFVPFFEDNIIQLYNEGKKLTDSLFSELFVNGRKWQKDYGFLKHDPDNWLMPCAIRDHFINFKKNIVTKKTKPEDKFAKYALTSKDYEKVLKKFDKELSDKSLPIWKEKYARKSEEK
ncbi:MAG: radical SAM/SPASM domain-containing protein [Candidatus Nanoarchaeia archaeon]|nr:radical SAM/SPASM domain-containing protein [Candidatus Nanoarchaeia archaeon]